MKFEIQAVRDVALSDVAEFLYRWHGNREDPPSSRAVPRNAKSIEQCLHWLLVENPVQDVTPHYGFCARDDSGVIRGLSLNFPNAFLAGDRRLVGLCSGSYYVEPQVRTAGFFLFKRYLEFAGYSFHFATTCNANSGKIWEKVDGAPMPNSETEHILPLRFDVMVPTFIGGRLLNGMAAGMGRALGRCGNFVSGLLQRRTSRLRVEPCRDWDRLAELSRRHRPRELITADRSVPFFEWRYGQNSPNHLADVCLFQDAHGNEGWFALGERMLGRDGQVRSAMVLDAVWPRSRMHPREILPAMIERASGWADAIFFSPRPGMDFRECSRLIVPRRFEAPRVWAKALEGTGFDLASLDVVSADGDSGWSNRFENKVAPISGPDFDEAVR
jgi:hypothetical protein